ncbi:hypothetical protein LS74_010215 [Helicobacter magdeburgensis]|uniref:Uncharacterized protein n=1 Tax=Helicobacter magdeburgensis TaxID=471858 RepID=A0A4U8SW31_9HELI|nr:hypothetical protein [Helicobacter magdeburgensis]TLD91113.1 hypothetical protein LS74_010215 [Helicobacter magdeburgensis]
MTLEQKGDRNLEIARFIDSDDFEKLSGFPKQHLCSTIINRLYYGVYLIGKQRLLQKDNSINAKKSLSHGTEYSIKSIKNNKEARKSSFLWVRLKGFYSDKKGLQLCLLAVKLHELRDIYDYNCDSKQETALKDLVGCKQQAQLLSKGLKELQ